MVFIEVIEKVSPQVIAATGFRLRFYLLLFLSQGPLDHRESLRPMHFYYLHNILSSFYFPSTGVEGGPGAVARRDQGDVHG